MDIGNDGFGFEFSYMWKLGLMIVFGWDILMKIIKYIKV